MFATVCLLLLVFFVFSGDVLATSDDYLYQSTSLGSTTQKINIKFLYHEGDITLENLYVNITKSGSDKAQIWDALYSTDADSNFWTTPVLRDIATGLSPLIIVQGNGLSPASERLEAKFYDKFYPVECTLRE